MSKLHEYHITYFLMIQGMIEPDHKDYGLHQADSPEEAKENLAYILYPTHKRDRDYFLGCLEAKQTPEIPKRPEPMKPYKGW